MEKKEGVLGARSRKSNTLSLLWGERGFEKDADGGGRCGGYDVVRKEASLRSADRGKVGTKKEGEKAKGKHFRSGQEKAASCRRLRNLKLGKRDVR